MLFDRAQPIIIIRDGSNNIENEKSKIIDQIARESGIPRDNIKVRIVALPSFSTLLDPIPLLTRHIFDGDGDQTNTNHTQSQTTAPWWRRDNRSSETPPPTNKGLLRQLQLDHEMEKLKVRHEFRQKRRK